LYEHTTAQQHRQVSNILSSQVQQQPVNWQNRATSVPGQAASGMHPLCPHSECCRTAQSMLAMDPVQTTFSLLMRTSTFQKRLRKSLLTLTCKTNKVSAQETHADYGRDSRQPR